MNRQKFDFALRDARGRIQLLIEVKRAADLAVNEASELRCWYLEGREPFAFLLVTHAHAFAWSAHSPDTAPPDVILDMSKELKPYFERTEIPPERVQPLAFELIVSMWLNDLLDGKLGDDVSAMLARLGVGSLRDARLLAEYAA
jgi:hypothetical protein